MKIYQFAILSAMALLMSCAAEEEKNSTDSVRTDSQSKAILSKTDSLLVSDTGKTDLPPPPPPPVPPAPFPDPRPCADCPYPVVTDVPPPPPDDAYDDTTKKAAEEEIVAIPEQQAHFPGGEIAMREYLNKNLRYPQMAKEANIEGKVYISFLVGTDGSISDVTVMRPVHPSLDNEALRVIKSMPDWVPAENHGKKVREKMIIPVHFSLE